MVGLVISYFFFVALGSSHIHIDFLKHSSWMKAFGALPIIFTAFSYQGLIPSLSTYFKHNRKILRLSIIIGSAIPFGISIIWDLLIKGIVPIEGVHGLIAAQKLGQTAVEPLQYYLGSPTVYIVGQFFAFFALTTSFFGVTLPLVDFLADGLKMKKQGSSRVFLVLLVYLPALGISVTNPTVFFKALNFAGGVGCVFLLGLMPILMVWSGRYRKKEAITVYEVPGGKITLVLLLIFIVFEVALTLKATLA
jgi:tyrosine-specific transport protein